jgi:pyruvate dehydrogenase E2 component (dihydrolipoamide acetyltransferase)
MSIEIKIPDIGSDAVEVTEILVNVGDTLAAEQSVITVEGDKATIEVPSAQAGVVKSILVKVGDKVETGMPMLTLDVADDKSTSNAENNANSKDAPQATSQSNNTAVEKAIAVPDIGDDEVEVTEVLVKVGDTIAADQSLIVVEGDKASMEVPAPAAGVIKAISLKAGDKVKTGTPMLTLLVSGGDTAKVEPVAAEPVADSANPAQSEKRAPEKQVDPSSATNNKADASTGSFVENSAYVHASPVIRRLAREFGVNLAQVKGTGRKSRILKEDLQNYVKQAVKSAESAGAGASLPVMLPWPKVDFSKFGEIEEVELGRIQKISGANLSRNWVMIPHVTHFDESDITELEDFRKQQNAEAAKRKSEVKITLVVFIMKALAKALEAFPRFNSSLSEDAQRLTLKKYIHIGVAVDTPNGLVVPVFRDVNKKGIITLSQELMEISQKARAGKLTAADMQGGCFTISSLGRLGTTSFTPIVNAPEVAILGVSRSSMKPVWNGKEFTPRLMLPLSLSFDHRVIDGAEGARFLTYLNRMLADIRRLVM